jgi:hypothetical protein
MAASYGPQANPGSFIPTTNIWDVSALYSTEVTSPEFKELLVRLYQNINLVALSMNTRDAGYYVMTEFVNGQIFFPNPSLTSVTTQAPTFRPVFRKVINFGALPNTGTKSVAHGITITSTFSFTRIYATASDQSGMNYIPIPYASPVLVNNIELNVDATNVNITTGSNRSNFTICYVILEYIKE